MKYTNYKDFTLKNTKTGKVTPMNRIHLINRIHYLEHELQFSRSNNKKLFIYFCVLVVTSIIWSLTS